MQVHTKAREIFLHAVRFISQHASFTVYYFFLMALSELLQVARTINLSGRIQDLTQAEGSPIKTATLLSSFLQNILSEDCILALQHPYTPYILFALSFVLLLVFMGVTFIVQALLRKRETSVVHETIHSFHALMRAPWAVLYFLALAAFTSFIPYLVTTQDVAAAATPFAFLPFFGLMLVFIVVWIALIYFQPLLYDNYHSLPSVLHTSWEYLKKSWFVLVKFFVIIGALNILLAVPFMAFGLPLTGSPIVAGIQFLLNTYVTLLSIIGFNMIYFHVRSEK
jgi:hypothetical protein